MPRDRGRDELINRASRKTGWASSALVNAAADLHNGGAGAEDLAGLTEVVLDEADPLARLADDIESRKGENAPKIGAGLRPRVTQRARLPYQRSEGATLGP
jgi:hypothetical protein